MSDEYLPVVVIGAGPIGLATVSHLAEQGLESVILERGSEPAASVADWGHVRLFSPWRLNIDPASGRLLERTGRWVPPEPDGHPTGDGLRDAYLLPLAEALPGVGADLELGAKVISVSRLSRDKARGDREGLPFEIAFERQGEVEHLLASAVVDASGSWGSPNPLGASGLPVPGERELADRIAYGIPDVLGAARERYAGRRTLVVGSGHSAMNVVIDLSRLVNQAPGTRFSWAIRRPASSVLTSENDGDPLPARAALIQKARHLVESRLAELLPELRVQEVRRSGEAVRVVHARGELEVDEIIAATGVRPDLSGLRELRLSLDPALEAPVGLAPLVDPQVHSCSTVPVHGAAELAHPEPDFYLAGMKSYGRAPTFLMSTGYHQARSIAAALAEAVEPVVPEPTVASCCAPPVAVAATGAGEVSSQGSGCGPSCG